jgi:RNA polymerase sigma factor (TIGR02999 family)
MPEQPEDVTELLNRIGEGDAMAGDRLASLVFDDLHRIAARMMRGERPEHTLEPTALVNEAYIRLIDQKRAVWQNRSQFFGVAASMMRRVLLDHARRHRTQKRGGQGLRVTLTDDLTAERPRSVDFIDLDRALTRLAEAAPDLCRLVELKYFTDLEAEEAAQILGVSLSTFERRLRTAKAFLHRELTRGQDRAT